MKKNLILISTVILLFACKQQQEKEKIQVAENLNAAKQESVIRPIDGLETPITHFKIDPNKDNTLQTAYGGEVKIPANSIVDATGKPISGEVDIQWKEYHTLTDILFSGIPMKYDSAGMYRDLVSGGMFSINAFKDGENLAVADGKSIDVKLGSISDTPCYNFYEMDTTTGVWTYETTAVGEKVADKPKTIDNKPDVITDKSIGTILEGKLNISDFPELQNKRLIGWKTMDKINLNTQKMLSSTNTMRKLNKNGNSYVLNLEQKQGDEIVKSSLNVTPYTLEDAQADKPKVQLQVDNLNETLFAYQDDKLDRKFSRSISVGNFGLYNWDICYNKTDMFAINTEFSYPDVDDQKEMQEMQAFYICPSNNLIIRTSGQGGNMFMNNNDDAIIVAISPKREVYVIKKDKIRNWKINNNSEKIRETFTKTPIILDKQRDLSPYLSSLY